MLITKRAEYGKLYLLSLLVQGKSQCCGNPTSEQKRRKLRAEAAERRQKENESRGLKDPEGAKLRREAAALQQGGTVAPMDGGLYGRNGGGLRWKID